MKQNISEKENCGLLDSMLQILSLNTIENRCDGH